MGRWREGGGGGGLSVSRYLKNEQIRFVLNIADLWVEIFDRIRRKASFTI